MKINPSTIARCLSLLTMLSFTRMALAQQQTSETQTDTQSSPANNVQTQHCGVNVTVSPHVCRNVNDDQLPTDVEKYEVWDRDHVDSPEEKDLKVVNVQGYFGPTGGTLTLKVAGNVAAIVCPLPYDQTEGKETIYWGDDTKIARYPQDNHRELTWTRGISEDKNFNYTLYIEGVETSEAPLDVTFHAEVKSPAGRIGNISYGAASATNSARTAVYEIDMDVDSLNDNADPYSATGFNDEEDRIEASEKEENGVKKPGKIVISALNADSDGNGIPDYAELSIPNVRFIPVQVNLKAPYDPEKAYVRFQYKESRPEESPKGWTVTGAGTAEDPRVYTLNVGGMRLWKKDAPSRSLADYIEPGKAYAWTSIADGSSRTKILYMEYVDKEIPEAAGRQEITITAANDMKSLEEDTEEVIVATPPSQSSEQPSEQKDIKTSEDKVIVTQLLVQLEELSPKLKDEKGKEIAGSEKPLLFPKSNQMVEEIKLEKQVEQNRIAHREMKVKISAGKVLAGKKVVWTMDPWGVKKGDAVRGDWIHSKIEEHKNRYEHSAAYGKYNFKATNQETGETTIAAVGEDGYTAIRANLPPIGWNHADIKINIVEKKFESTIARFVVPAVVVVDAGHGGEDDIKGKKDIAALGRSTANNAKGGYWDPNGGDKKYQSVKSYDGATGVLEKTLTLSYSAELEKQLKAEHKELDLPLRIYQTRTGNNNLGGYIRARVARDNGADVFLSLHFNSADGPFKLQRGTIVTSRRVDNVNLEEDLSFENRIVPPVNAALLAIDSTNRPNKDPVKEGNAVTSDIMGFFQDKAYHPIRSTLIEIDFIHNESGDKLINGVNKDRAKQNSMKALAGAILEELTVFKVQNDK